VLFERPRLGWLATLVDRGVVWLVDLTQTCIAVGRVAAVVVVVRIIIAVVGAIVAARCACRVPMSQRTFGFVFIKCVTLPKLPVAKRA
jgi:hypothetical protein